MVQKSSSPGKPVASERGQTEGYDQDGPAPAGQEEVPEGTPHCDVPSRAEWSKAAGGPPETGGTDHQAVGHPKSPGAPDDLQKKFTDAQRGQVLHVASDAPSAELFQTLKEVLPNLQDSIFVVRSVGFVRSRSL
ncbi:hypothetical protein AK812_SmicGene18384 [Symbiodinium microadriaticum]|uniref:Uncharacterized protein n=1 Tax=Symbiodinium microadriaticum TaxID=2951 RepID=A0A1Q9DV80_SYMMI|nr:hypothetical protein AK812_SmicGene18384 [Symbiodinium microadriaticum]